MNGQKTVDLLREIRHDFESSTGDNGIFGHNPQQAEVHNKTVRKAARLIFSTDLILFIPTALLSRN